MVLNSILGWIKWSGLVVAGLVLGISASTAMAETRSQAGLDKGQYIPNIWVDPDGCEHWVMDDGWEGFMSPHVDRNGRPVCRDGSICAMVRTDTFFASDSAAISADGAAKLQSFFQESEFRTFAIAGHTDSTASDAYNMQLSRQRADAVASIARSSGARISSVTGYGERKPFASNDSASGRAQNRRVEIMCVN